VKTIGVVTIGQSPRNDVVAEIEKIIKNSPTLQTVTFLQKGALDGLTIDEIADLRPTTDKNHLVTVLRDGTEVAVDKQAVCPRVQRAVFELESEGADIITLLCSGGFPPFCSDAPLIVPAKLLAGVLSAISITGKLGVVVPSEKQVGATEAAYKSRGFHPIVVGASPYPHGEAFLDAVDRLKGQVALVVMDCFGFNLSAKRQVSQITGVPVILVRSVLARALIECLD